jgi:hypothetical protein
MARASQQVSSGDVRADSRFAIYLALVLINIVERKVVARHGIRVYSPQRMR